MEIKKFNTKKEYYEDIIKSQQLKIYKYWVKNRRLKIIVEILAAITTVILLSMVMYFLR